GKKSNIRFFGFRRSDEATRLLSRAHVGYVPYWFDLKYSDCVRQCFPNKISLYISSNLPILYHGPADSSVQRFLEKYPVGLACNTLDPVAIAETVRRFLHEEQLRATAGIAREAAIAQELGVSAARRRLAQFIGCAEQQFITDGTSSSDTRANP